MSAREFARALTDAGYPVSHSSVLDYEKGEPGSEKVPGAYLAAVCITFRRDPRWLLTGQGREEWVPEGDDLYRAGKRDLAHRVADRLADVIEELAAADEAIPRWCPSAPGPADSRPDQTATQPPEGPSEKREDAHDADRQDWPATRPHEPAPASEAELASLRNRRRA